MISHLKVPELQSTEKLFDVRPYIHSIIEIRFRTYAEIRGLVLLKTYVLIVWSSVTLLPTVQLPLNHAWTN